MRIIECPRHQNFMTPKEEAGPDRPYYLERCSHIEDRAVVQVNCYDGHFTTVDYVEYLPGGGVIVEASSPDGGDIDRMWDYLIERMRADITPNPDI